MIQIWKFKNSKSNKLVLIKDRKIYFGNPKEIDFTRLDYNTKDIEFLKKIFCIPFSYISKIENQVGQKNIKIFYSSKSEENIIIENETIKNEIFDLLKKELSNFKYTSEIPKLKKYAKPQILSLLIISGIAIWSLYLAGEVEKGVIYENKSTNPGLSGVVLLIASLGSVKILTGYFIILGITISAIIKKYKTISKIETLIR